MIELIGLSDLPGQLHRYTARTDYDVKIRTLDSDGVSSGWGSDNDTRLAIQQRLYAVPGRTQMEYVEDGAFIPGYNHVRMLETPDLDITAILDQAGRLVYTMESGPDGSSIDATLEPSGVWSIKHSRGLNPAEALQRHPDPISWIDMTGPETTEGNHQLHTMPRIRDLPPQAMRLDS